MGKNGQRILKIIHLLFSSLWVGGSITLLLMVKNLGPGESGMELYGYSMAIKFVDDLIIVPGAIGTLISGIIICCCTNWGFFKHRFVTVKLIMTVICILVGIFVLGPTVNNQPGIIAEYGLFALTEPDFQSNKFFCLLGGGVQLLAILFLLAISTLKPWARKKKNIVEQA
jgi:putative copper export protein